VKTQISILMMLVLVGLALAGCGSQPPTQSPPTPTNTPDPCDQANIEAGVRGVNQFMREFDDASELASNVPRDNLAEHIASLQGVRRAAEDQMVPECLERLKALELLHMNLVIKTLMAFIGGSASQEDVTSGVAAAQVVHNQYLLEASGLLGLTPVVVTVAPTAIASADTGTSDATAVAEATAAVAQPPAPPTPAVLAINPGPNAISLRADMNATSAVVGVLQSGESAVALGTSPESAWIKVIVPGNTELSAWVSASEVQLTNASP